MQLDENLLNKLFELRAQLKEKEKKETGRTPVICSDEALYDIATYKPRAPYEFESLPGLGRAFSEKYGQIFADTVGSFADKGFTTKMSGDITRTLKELEKNLITLNKKNRLLFTTQLRPRDSFDMSIEAPEDAIKFLFGKKLKIVIKNTADINYLELDSSLDNNRNNSSYKKITTLLRETNRDLREKGQNNLYMAYPFVKGKIHGEDFDIRAPLAFFPVKAEKNSLQITITSDNSRDIIYNNALVLANYKFNKIKKPLPNPVLEQDVHSPEELFTAIENFYLENEIQLKRDPLYHHEKAIALEEDFTLKPFETYKKDEFPVFKKGELYIEDVMLLGRYLICDSTIQKDFDDLIERKESTVQLDKLLKSFSQLQNEEDSNSSEKEESKLPFSETNLSYINSLNSSQEQVLTSMNNLDQLVVQGPPGTGKSQTITSLIADYALKDKTVLLVSEKKTALDVVYSRLGDLSQYALLIDDVSNKNDFFRQIQGMVTSASMTSGDFENLTEISTQIETDMSKLDQIAQSLYKSKTIGTDTFNLYQNSSKIDLADFNTSQKVLKIESAYGKELLKLDFENLTKEKQLFTNEELCQNISFFVKTKNESPALLYVKSGLSELESSKIKNIIINFKQEILNLQNQSFFAKVFGQLNLTGKMKAIIKEYISSGRFYKYTMANPDSVISALDEYKKFQECRIEYEKLSKSSKVYFDALNFIKTDSQDFSTASKDLYNVILNIHLSKFEAANIETLTNVRQYRETIRHIANFMGDKRRNTINNTGLKLANYMKGLTDSKRCNEIIHALESSRKPSVKKFLGKFKVELFDSVKIWMLTPEVVSELIPLQQGIFDLVIFDEASQMFVEKGIPSIFRAKKVVIAGDSKQLRPTRLFSGRFEENPEEMEEEEETVEALEEKSLLDLARYKYDNIMLKYHYRSKYEELIAFSNHAFYKGQLLVSPNAIASEKSPIEVHKVQDGIWTNTANKKEAQYCVQLVKKILKERKNNETIGIITFNSHQHDMVEDCLDLECMRDKEFESALALERNRVENGEDISLFVKNIENVQGDERDIIIFSVGFAKNQDGKIYRNYGWLNNEGGENRLNVAISRAKSKIHIVTSVQPAELIVDDLKHEGPKLLRKYLEYCFAIDSDNLENARNILSNLSAKTVTFASQPSATEFKDSVCKFLQEKGYTVEQNVGIGGYSIDIAIKKGKDFVLGIECDSSLYNNKTQTRERDFHRQKFLESRGWTVYRLWSCQWWADQAGELEKMKELMEK